jgi:hypothetical protein
LDLRLVTITRFHEARGKAGLAFRRRTKRSAANPRGEKSSTHNVSSLTYQGITRLFGRKFLTSSLLIPVAMYLFEQCVGPGVLRFEGMRNAAAARIIRRDGRD